MPKYIVTTYLERVPQDMPVFMIDGTVPGWEPREQDYHFDHHKPGGTDIQIDGVGLTMWDLQKVKELDGNYYLVTTQLDADACCTAAYIQTYPYISWEALQKLRAISYDCDHLGVPLELEQYANFAAQAVAGMKEYGKILIDLLALPKDRNVWSQDQKEEFYNCSFEHSTQWLIDAVKEKRKYPGESGEAKVYWEQLQTRVGLLLSQNRIRFYRGCPIFDLRGVDGYTDPRACLRAMSKSPIKPETKVTITYSLRGKGYKYTIADTNPTGDLTQGTFGTLTKLDKALNPDFDSWSGRKTVGGSSWNGYSLLEPWQVIDTILSHNVQT